jgi:anthranilate synthase component 1
MTVLQRSFDGFTDLLTLHRRHPTRYPFLLESVARATQGGMQNNWDILFAFPGETLQLGSDAAPDDDFLARLDQCWQQERFTVDGEQALPFTGGWFLYLAYELVAQIEPTLSLTPVRQGIPRALAVRCPAAVLRDHRQQRTVVVAEAGNAEYLEQICADVEAQRAAVDADENVSAPLTLTALSEEAPERFLSAVSRIKDFIRDGDVFQVNLSRAWHGRIGADTSAADIYAALCRHNPAPFAALCRYDDWAVISSSPERLVRIDRRRHVETRPIAGTHPRCDNHAEDQRLSQALLQHPKEQAEHIMLIDMERNDLGRVCAPGSIRVDELMVLESYRHVHHIVSNVRGRLRDGVTPGQVLRAVFPGGTITGCPKVRCMEIIAELEGAERGPYTGSVGYLNRDGSLDLNILIRTLFLRQDSLTLRAGAGIVNDSVPERELAETRAKARGVLTALGKSETELRAELGWSNDADQWQKHDTNQCA